MKVWGTWEWIKKENRKKFTDSLASRALGFPDYRCQSAVSYLIAQNGVTEHFVVYVVTFTTNWQSYLKRAAICARAEEYFLSLLLDTSEKKNIVPEEMLYLTIVLHRQWVAGLGLAPVGGWFCAVPPDKFRGSIPTSNEATSLTIICFLITPYLLNTHKIIIKLKKNGLDLRLL